MVKMKNALKEITARKSNLSWEQLKLKLSQKVTGWVSYFRYANAKKKLQALDEWLNNNLLRRAGYTFLYDVYQKVHTAI